VIVNESVSERDIRRHLSTEVNNRTPKTPYNDIVQ